MKAVASDDFAAGSKIVLPEHSWQHPGGEGGGGNNKDLPLAFPATSRLALPCQ